MSKAKSFVYKDNVKLISLKTFCFNNQHLNYINEFDVFCNQNTIIYENKTENDWFLLYHKYLPNIVNGREFEVIKKEIDEDEIINFK
jgi:hypothetical protein